MERHYNKHTIYVWKIDEWTRDPVKGISELPTQMQDVPVLGLPRKIRMERTSVRSWVVLAINRFRLELSSTQRNLLSHHETNFGLVSWVNFPQSELIEHHIASQFAFRSWTFWFFCFEEGKKCNWIKRECRVFSWTANYLLVYLRHAEILREFVQHFWILLIQRIEGRNFWSWIIYELEGINQGEPFCVTCLRAIASRAAKNKQRRASVWGKGKSGRKWILICIIFQTQMSSYWFLSVNITFMTRRLVPKASV